MKVQIFDPSGNEKFYYILGHNAHGGDVRKFVYDVTGYSSFRNIKYWYDLIVSRYADCDNNNDDLQRIVTFEEASELAKGLGI